MPGAKRWKMRIGSAYLQFESINFKLHGRGKWGGGEGVCRQNYCDAVSMSPHITKCYEARPDPAPCVQALAEVGDTHRGVRSENQSEFEIM